MSGRISVQGIDPQVIETFKQMVENKYGKLHTVYAQEIEKAMRQYLQSQENPNFSGFTPGEQHTHTQKPPTTKNDQKLPKKSHFARKTEHLAYIMDNKNAWDCEEFPRPVAEKIIKTRVGADPRTVNKYLSELENMWLLSRDV